MKPSNPAEVLPSLPRGAEILVIRLRSLGDMVMLTPALDALHAWRPDLRLVVLAEPAFAPVLEGNPAVAEILLYEGFFSTVRALRRRRFPVVFNQHAGPTSALLTAASGSAARVCWANRQFSFFYNVLAPAPQEFFGARPVHTVEHRLTQFYWGGLPRGPVPPARVFPQPDAVAEAQRKLAERGIQPGQAYVVVHPGASDARKRWSLEGYGEVARQLQQEHGLTPVVRLGPGDSALAEGIARCFPQQTIAFDFAAMDLRQTIALIAGARLFVGNDSGPAHLATAAARPVAVIFGSSDAATWRPWQTEHRVVEAAGPCPRCREGRCYAASGPRCILSVSVEQVRKACAELLKENGKGKMENGPA